MHFSIAESDALRPAVAKSVVIWWNLVIYTYEDLSHSLKFNNNIG